MKQKCECKSNEKYHTTHLSEAQPVTYAKGPNVISQSKWTQQHYQKSWKGQTSLSSFGFQRSIAPGPGVLSDLLDAPVSEPAESEASELTPSIILPHVQSVSIMSDLTFIDDQEASKNTEIEDILGEDDAEKWEEELDSTLASSTEVRDWKTRCDNI